MGIVVSSSSSAMIMLNSTNYYNIILLSLCNNINNNEKNDTRDSLLLNMTRYEDNSQMLNLTCLDHAPSLTNRAFIKAIILSVMAIISLIANAITIWSIIKNRRKHHQGYSAIYTLILHLSVADLLVTIFCIAGEALWSYTVAWIWGNVGCKLFKFLQMFSLYLSTFILVLIGLDRFLAVKYPIKSLNKTDRCTKLVLITWIISFILSIPQLIIFHVARGPFIEEFSQCVTHGFYTQVWQEQLYTTLSLIFMFVLPLIILVITYVSTVITISRSEKSFKTEVKNNNNNNNNKLKKNSITGDLNRRRLMHRAKSKSLRISIVIVTAFVIWWTPYYIMMIIFMFLDPDEHLSQDLQSGIFFFGMSNSLVNPLIYGAFHLWPRKKSHQKFCQRDGSMIHHRSTTTHTSFTLGTRGCSTRLIRNPDGFSSSFPIKTTIKQAGKFNEISGPIEDTTKVLVTLINDPKNNNNEISTTRHHSAKLILQYNTNHHSDSNNIKKKLIDYDN